MMKDSARLKIAILLSAIAAILVAGCGRRTEPVHRIVLQAEDEPTYDDDTRCTLIADGDTMSCGVHLRGGYSRRFSKHSYALKFGSRYPLCGLPADKDWVLNASAVDRTFMRHRLSFDIFRAMHPDNRSPMCAYALMDSGLYVVMQKPDASTLGIDKTSDAAVIFKEPPLLYADSVGEMDEFQKYPKPRKGLRTDGYERLRWLIHEADDSTFGAEIGTMVELRSVADLHLLVLLTNNADGLLKGYYLYCTGADTRFRMAPWDYDHAFGRDGDGEPNMLERTVNDTVSPLLHRLLKTGFYPTLLADRWTELRRSGVIDTKTLLKRVDALDRTLRRAAQTDLQRWPEDETGYMPEPDFDDEVEIIRHFIPLSIERLDKRFGYKD